MSSSDKESIFRFFGNPWIIAPGILLLLLVATVFVVRAVRIAGLPDIGDPFDVEAFTSIEVSDADNAFVEYRVAVNRLVPLADEHSTSLNKAQERGWAAPDEHIRQWVADNRPAMEMWRYGTEKQKALYHHPSEMDLTILLPVAQELRTFGRLALLEASRLEAEGDVAGAWGWYRAIFRCSRHSGAPGSIIERLIGIVLHAMAVERAVQWAAHPDVDSALLRQALHDVQADYAMTAATSDTLKVEYLSMQNLLAKIEQGELTDFVKYMMRTPTPTGRVLRLVMFLFNEPEVTHRVSDQLYANWLSQMDLPLPQRAPKHSGPWMLFDVQPEGPLVDKQLPADELDAFINDSFIVRLLIPAFEQFSLAVTKEQARQAALVVALAAQRYHREEGQFPSNIADFQQFDVIQFPTDPFSMESDLLHYRRDDEGALVWSVGRNGVNDGGKLELNEAARQFLDVGYRIHPPGTVAATDRTDEQTPESADHTENE